MLLLAFLHVRYLHRIVFRVVEQMVTRARVSPSVGMLRLLSALACLAALEAAVVTVPHVRPAVPAPPKVRLSAASQLQKSEEPAVVTLPLTKVENSVSSLSGSRGCLRNPAVIPVLKRTYVP